MLLPPDTDLRIRDFLTAYSPPPGKRLWYGGASLLGTLRGVRADQAAWQAPGHDHSIWQLLLHCAYSRYNVRRLLEGKTERGAFPRPGGYWARLPEVVDEASWSEDKALLRTEHQRLAEAAARFEPARLDEQATQENTFIDLLWGIVMHDLVHVGEMQVLKRLYELQSPEK
jgi:uncharacterized damage-inducible protein DinB